MEIKRLNYLDYLRGAAAAGIMLYHYLSWSRGPFNSSDVFGRIGIYGVSIFYVLSGLTLFHVYFNQTPDKVAILNFAIKRIFRIVPLFAAISILSMISLKQPIPISHIILNLTCLFGFVYPGAYYTNGGWSIGNEMVFYLFFVFYFISYHRSKVLFSVLSLLTLVAYGVFAHLIILPEQTIDSQWLFYINPFNQLFLFLGGILIGLLSKAKTAWFNNIACVILILLSIIAFVLIPTEPTDRVLIITGLNRWLFTIVCFTICLALYNLKIELPKLFHKVGVFFAETSYCLYLVHGLCFMYSQKILNSALENYPERYRFLFAIALTIGFSYVSYITLEKYFIGQGKKLINKVNGKFKTLH